MSTRMCHAVAVIILLSAGVASVAAAGPNGRGHGPTTGAQARGPHGPRGGGHAQTGDHPKPGVGHRGEHANPTGALIAADISKNHKLRTRLTGLLPQGITLAEAANGFRNRGQFIAALNASNHFGIPFSDLKTEMTTNHLSLGQALKKLRPEHSATTSGDEDGDHTKPAKPEHPDNDIDHDDND